MLDRKYIIQNADLVRENCQRRGVDCDIDRIVSLEAAAAGKAATCRRSESTSQRDQQAIPKAKDDAERQELIAKGRQLREQKDAAPARRLDHEIISCKR